jgi:putative flavoprotein involved in K+ transport
MDTRFDTIVIGGGQAGLATGYYLAKLGRSFVILDKHARVGDAWRMRWDSLRVFTPAKYNGLPGMRFPAPSLTFPTKDEVADYMAAYAARFQLPVRSGVAVDLISRNRDGFVVSAGSGTFEADNVIVATGAHHIPRIPDFAGGLAPQIGQLHSSAYKNPSQLSDGAVLVVGAGNSGAEISYDVSHSHRVFLSGTPSAQLPVRHGAAAAIFVLPLIKFLGTHVLTVDTPMGRKALPKMKTAPLIRVKLNDLEKAGVERVARVTGAQDGLPILADGRVLEVANLIWCTGFRPDFTWINLPRAFADDGRLDQYRGVASSEPGLYFVGMYHQYSAVSDVLPGVGRDAAYVVRHIANRRPVTASSTPITISEGDLLHSRS